METNEEFINWYSEAHLNLIDALDQLNIEYDVLSEDDNPGFVDQHSEFIPLDLARFYKQLLNGYHIKWAFDKESEMVGSIFIWPVEELFNVKNLVQLDGEETKVNVNSNTRLKLNLNGVFRKVDYFVDEEQVGFFSDPSMKFRFYYMDSDQEFWDLKLDFKGYFELACAARAFNYWQQAILFREFKKSYMQSGSDNFIESMPELFPDFKINEFFALYDSLKLKD